MTAREWYIRLPKSQREEALALVHMHLYIGMTEDEALQLVREEMEHGQPDVL